MPAYQSNVPNLVLGYQELAVAGSVVQLTVLQGTDVVRLVFVQGPIQYTLDGTTPTSSVGMEGVDGMQDLVSAHAASLAKFIRTGSVNGIVKAVFLRFQ